MFFQLFYRLTGENFGYHVTRTTNKNGQICIPFLIGGRARITLPCSNQFRVVDGNRASVQCAGAESKYDFPKSAASKESDKERMCEEHTFIVTQLTGNDDVFRARQKEIIT